VDTLADLIDRMQTGRIAPLKRIVIETTGLADPVPVLQAVMGHPALMQALRLDGVVCAVDAVNGAATLDAHEEAVRQVAVADRIVVTKEELAGAEGETEALRARLRRLNPSALILRAEGASASALLDCGRYDPRTKTADVRRWLGAGGDGHAHDGHHHHGAGHDHRHHHHGHHHHDSRIATIALSHDRPVPFAVVEAFLDLLRSV